MNTPTRYQRIVLNGFWFVSCLSVLVLSFFSAYMIAQYMVERNLEQTIWIHLAWITPIAMLMAFGLNKKVQSFHGLVREVNKRYSSRV